VAEIEVPNPDELHERGETTFGRRAALTTAIYAVVLSIASLGGNNTVKEMLLAQQQSPLCLLWLSASGLDPPARVLDPGSTTPGDSWA